MSGPTAFVAQAWERTAGVRAEIDALPFVRGLADGSLPRTVFDEYLRQDVLYLDVYARALARCGELAPDRADGDLWTGAAERTLVLERDLHVRHVAGTDVTPWAACTGYTGHLTALAEAGDYATLGAAVIPCYLVYADVGARLAAAVGPDRLDRHPYGAWLAVWGGEEFGASAARAAAAVDRAADGASEPVRHRMLDAFVTSTRWEHRFWGDLWPPAT